MFCVSQMFCRTQWPSPDEYSQLEAQTSLGRTDIVRWFKDHRSALKSGETLDWLEAFHRAGQDQNGQEKTQNASVELTAVQRGFQSSCCCLLEFFFFDFVLVWFRSRRRW